MKVSRSAISDLEGGKRRSISVAELLVLATALEVPPGLLMFPGYPDRTVEYLPGEKASSRSAVRWVSGNLQHDPEFGMIDRTDSIVGYANSRDHYTKELARSKRILLEEEFAESEDREHFQNYVERVEKTLRITKRELKRHGGTTDDGSR